MSKKTNKYQLIVDDVRAKILQGVFPGGYKLPGQFELAEQYKVSAITANRALNELREMGLIERRERSGSYVLDSPRFLGKIFIVMSGQYENETENLMPYWQKIRELALAKGIKIQLISMTNPDFSSLVLKNKQSGFGVVFLLFMNEAVTDELEKNATPYVVLGIKSDKAKYNVTEDRFGAARKLTRQMIEKGCRNIAFFGTRVFPNHHEAERGVLDGVRESAHDEVTLKIYNTTEKNVNKKISSVLGENHPPDSAVIMGGMMPFLALPIIMKEGKSLSLGFMTENQTVLQLQNYALIASYKQEEAAQLAFEMLLDIAAGKITCATTKFSDVKILTP